MEKVIRLTEDELRGMIKDGVDEALNELSISQKKRNVKDFENAFRKGKRGFNGIKTICVLTSENPDSQEASAQFNKKARKSLLNDIKSGRYAYVPAIGQFGNAEHPYAVFNMPLNTAKFLCGKYQQTSFIYSQLNDNGSIHSEYWEKNDTNMPYNKCDNDYVLQDECDEWEDKSEAKDFFTVVGNKFKYSIPFKIFENVNNAIWDNAAQMVEVGKKRGINHLNESKVIEWTMRVGISPYLWRKTLTKNVSDF
jgi:hypothetical protein